MKTKIKTNKNGSAIAYGLVVIAVVSIILTSMIQYVVSQVKYGFYVESKEEAFRIAESGINFYRWYLAHQTDGKTTAEVRDFWANGSPLGVGTPLEHDYADTSGNVIGKYRISVSAPSPTATSVVVESAGWTLKYPNAVRTIRVVYRRSAWSDYAVLTNDFSAFDTTWDINGKIMSNTGIHFDGVVRNVAYAGSSSYSDPDFGSKSGVWTNCPAADGCNGRGESDVFLAGKKFPVVKKDFTGVTVDLNSMMNLARSSGDNRCNAAGTGCYFDNGGAGMQGRRIKLKDDGKFEISIVEQVKNNSNSIKKEKVGSVQTYDIPQNGIIFVNGNVWIDGKLKNKRVTVAAAILPNLGTSAVMYIGADNIIYNSRSGDEALGLISQSDIELSDDAPSDTEIDAAMLAQSGRVWKRDYNPNCCGSGCVINKNSINVYGSVISNQDMGFTVSKLCNPSKKNGYNNKSIAYDSNFLTNPPPFFPSDVYYAIDLWEEL